MFRKKEIPGSSNTNPEAFDVFKKKTDKYNKYNKLVTQIKTLDKNTRFIPFDPPQFNPNPATTSSEEIAQYTPLKKEQEELKEIDQRIKNAEQELELQQKGKQTLDMRTAVWQKCEAQRKEISCITSQNNKQIIKCKKTMTKITTKINLLNNTDVTQPTFVLLENSVEPEIIVLSNNPKQDTSKFRLLLDKYANTKTMEEEKFTYINQLLEKYQLLLDLLTQLETVLQAEKDYNKTKESPQENNILSWSRKKTIPTEERLKQLEEQRKQLANQQYELIKKLHEKAEKIRTEHKQLAEKFNKQNPPSETSETNENTIPFIAPSKDEPLLKPPEDQTIIDDALIETYSKYLLKLQKEFQETTQKTTDLITKNHEESLKKLNKEAPPKDSQPPETISVENKEKELTLTELITQCESLREKRYKATDTHNMWVKKILKLNPEANYKVLKLPAGKIGNKNNEKPAYEKFLPAETGELNTLTVLNNKLEAEYNGLEKKSTQVKQREKEVKQQYKTMQSKRTERKKRTKFLLDKISKINLRIGTLNKQYGYRITPLETNTVTPTSSFDPIPGAVKLLQKFPSEVEEYLNSQSSTYVKAIKTEEQEVKKLEEIIAKNAQIFETLGIIITNNYEHKGEKKQPEFLTDPKPKALCFLNQEIISHTTICNKLIDKINNLNKSSEKPPQNIEQLKSTGLSEEDKKDNIGSQLVAGEAWLKQLVQKIATYEKQLNELERQAENSKKEIEAEKIQAENDQKELKRYKCKHEHWINEINNDWVGPINKLIEEITKYNDSCEKTKQPPIKADLTPEAELPHYAPPSEKIDPKIETEQVKNSYNSYKEARKKITEYTQRLQTLLRSFEEPVAEKHKKIQELLNQLQELEVKTTLTNSQYETLKKNFDMLTKENPEPATIETIMALDAALQTLISNVELAIKTAENALLQQNKDIITQQLVELAKKEEELKTLETPNYNYTHATLTQEFKTSNANKDSTQQKNKALADLQKKINDQIETAQTAIQTQIQILTQKLSELNKASEKLAEEQETYQKATDILKKPNPSSSKKRTLKKGNKENESKKGENLINEKPAPLSTKTSETKPPAPTLPLAKQVKQAKEKKEKLEKELSEAKKTYEERKKSVDAEISTLEESKVQERNSAEEAFENTQIYLELTKAKGNKSATIDITYLKTQARKIKENHEKDIDDLNEKLTNANLELENIKKDINNTCEKEKNNLIIELYALKDPKEKAISNNRKKIKEAFDEFTSELNKANQTLNLNLEIKLDIDDNPSASGLEKKWGELKEQKTNVTKKIGDKKEALDETLKSKQKKMLNKEVGTEPDLEIAKKTTNTLKDLTTKYFKENYPWIAGHNKKKNEKKKQKEKESPTEYDSVEQIKKSKSYRIYTGLCNFPLWPFLWREDAKKLDAILNRMHQLENPYSQIQKKESLSNIETALSAINFKPLPQDKKKAAPKSDKISPNQDPAQDELKKYKTYHKGKTKISSEQTEHASFIKEINTTEESLKKSITENIEEMKKNEEELHQLSNGAEKKNSKEPKFNLTETPADIKKGLELNEKITQLNSDDPNIRLQALGKSALKSRFEKQTSNIQELNQQIKEVKKKAETFEKESSQKINDVKEKNNNYIKTQKEIKLLEQKPKEASTLLKGPEKLNSTSGSSDTSVKNNNETKDDYAPPELKKEESNPESAKNEFTPNPANNLFSRHTFFFNSLRDATLRQLTWQIQIVDSLLMLLGTWILKFYSKQIANTQQKNKVTSIFSSLTTKKMEIPPEIEEIYVQWRKESKHLAELSKSGSNFKEAQDTIFQNSQHKLDPLIGGLARYLLQNNGKKGEHSVDTNELSKQNEESKLPFDLNSKETTSQINEFVSKNKPPSENQPSDWEEEIETLQHKIEKTKQKRDAFAASSKQLTTVSQLTPDIKLNEGYFSKK